MKKVILLAIAVIFLISFANAQAEWTQYGGDLTAMWNSQFPSFHGVFNMTNVNSSSVSASYYPNAYNIQPLISNLGYPLNDSGYKHYLIFPYGSYLQIYDKQFTFYDEVNTYGTVAGQISITDFDMDGSRDDIVGIWNSTYFRAYGYDYSLNKYSLINSSDLSISDNLTTIVGVRSSGYNSYMMARNSSSALLFVKVNSSNGKDIIVTTSWIDSYLKGTLAYSEPLAFYDVDNDGQLEFLFYDSSIAVLFRQDGTVLFSRNTSQLSSTGILDAKLLQVDSTNQWRIAILYRVGTQYRIDLGVFRQDTSNLWTSTLIGASASYTQSHCKLAISDDYDYDLTNDDDEIFSACYVSITAVGRNEVYYVLKGRTGASLVSKTVPYTNDAFGIIEMTIADMNNDGYDDIIRSHVVGTTPWLNIFNPKNQTFIYNQTFGSGTGALKCVPADLTFDGKLDLVCCQNSTTTLMNVGDISNNNPAINSVTYIPSTTVGVGETLSESISATDSEGDTIYYSVKCSDDSSWGSETTSSTQTCVYSSVGTYNNTVRVRDLYHLTYNYFSYDILVTETGGTSCNTNGICESSLGETTVSCPADCPAIPETISTEGGTEIPTKLVDVNNEDEGLFPLVYQATLKFFSAVIIPLFWIVFAVLITMTILAIFGILKKLANRIG